MKELCLSFQRGPLFYIIVLVLANGKLRGSVIKHDAKADVEFVMVIDG
jgi:hypothetical protein